MLPTILLWIFLTRNISCDLPPFLFPSYDNVIGDNSTEVICPELDEISNGKIGVQKLSPTRKVATITCDRGYDIEGNNKIYCVDGQWVFYNSLPRCVKRCLPPPYLKDGGVEIQGIKDQEGYYPKGTVASYSCEEGYQLIPETSNMRVCERGIWTGPMATCVPNVIQVLGCSTPKSIENGYFVHEKGGELEGYNSFGQRLHYNCKQGYSLVGPRVQQCIEDGSWSPKLQPICKPRDDTSCAKLPKVLHGNIEREEPDGDSTESDTVEVRCLGKYQNPLNPCRASKLKCENGKWVGLLPFCVAAQECIPPPRVQYATIVDMNYNIYDDSNPTNFPLKSTVTYQCLQGFVLQGEPLMSCTNGGCWSPSEPPTCVRPRAPPARQPAGDNFFLEVDNINAIVMSAAAGAGVLGFLLLICLMVACKRKKQHNTTVAIPQPLPRQDLGDHAVLLEHPDRLALIAFADGVQRNQNLLPTYDEAVRSERGAPVAAGRFHRPHWPNLAGRRARNSPNPDAGHVTRHGSFASHTPSTRSAGDSMGSTDTMAVSEGSTNVTLDTASSHSGSQPASCRAHCGSLASFDACSVVNTEDVPLLEESELEEIQGGTNDMENPAISENSSLKISTNSGDILSV